MFPIWEIPWISVFIIYKFCGYSIGALRDLINSEGIVSTVSYAEIKLSKISYFKFLIRTITDIISILVWEW